MIDMGSETKILSMLFVSIMLIASYGYVTGEVEAVADDDPTHTGKAYLAATFPIIWLFLIMVSLGYVAYEISQDFG